jgi:ABC-2 type transport system permease protein
MVSLGNMVVSFATLYKSQEVNFLLTLPISFQKIFIVKFFDNFFYSSSTMFLIGSAVLLGYGTYFKLSWYFYPFALLGLMVPFMLIAASFSVLLLMALIRIATPSNFKKLAALIVVLYGIAGYLYFKLTNPTKLFDDVMAYFPHINQYLSNLDPPFARFLPNQWVADILYFISSGNSERSVPLIVILILTALGFLVVLMLLSAKLYYPSWIRAGELKNQKSKSKIQKGRSFKFQVQSSSRNSKLETLTPKLETLNPKPKTQNPKPETFFDFRQPSFFSSQIESLLKRDYAQFFREPSQWIHLVVMILLIGVFIFSMLRMNLFFRNALLASAAYLVVFSFDSFLISSMTVRFVFPMVSLEGSAFWAVKSAPLSLRTLFWQKFFTAFIPLLFISEVLVILSTHAFPVDAFVVWITAFVILIASFTLTSMGIGIGAYFANFAEKNPIRIASSQGASLTLLVALVYQTILVSILFVPLFQYFDARLKGESVEASSFTIPLLVLVVLSSVLSAVILWGGQRSLRRDV